MESSRQKKCPGCSSYDVFDTGNRAGGGEAMSFGDLSNAFSFPVYRCRHCHQSFIFLGHYREKSESLSGGDDTIGGMPF